jgi:hypothetical protein
MMKFKKFLASAMTGAMMFGLVATATPAVSAYAETSAKLGTSETMIFHAAAREAETVTKSGISYDKMTLTIESEDPYVVVEFYKDFTKLDKVSNTYTYANTNGTVVVDLGFFKPTKKAGIRYYGSSLTDEKKKAIAVEPINVQEGKFSVKVDASKDNFIDATKDKSKNFSLTAENINDYSYRSLYATEWKELGELDEFEFNTAKVAGTTIVIRKDATEEAPASPEVKVKIGASAKAPKVSIDYVKETIKSVSEKQEIALLEGTAIETFTQKGTKNMTVDALAKAIGGDVNVGFTVVIRTNDGKKAPSMPTFLYVKPAPVIVANGATATTSGAAITVEAVEGGLKLKPTDNSGTFQYEKSPNTNKWMTIKGETTIKTGEKSIRVRTAPQNENLKKNLVGKFASDPVTITAPASVEDKDKTGID